MEARSPLTPHTATTENHCTASVRDDVDPVAIDIVQIRWLAAGPK